MFGILQSDRLPKILLDFLGYIDYQEQKRKDKNEKTIEKRQKRKAKRQKRKDNREKTKAKRQ